MVDENNLPSSTLTDWSRSRCCFDATTLTKPFAISQLNRITELSLTRRQLDRQPYDSVISSPLGRPMLPPLNLASCGLSFFGGFGSGAYCMLDSSVILSAQATRPRINHIYDSVRFGRYWGAGSPLLGILWTLFGGGEHCIRRSRLPDPNFSVWWAEASLGWLTKLTCHLPP